MSDAYAQVTDVQDRLDWTLTSDEMRVAVAALQDASDDARFYGRDWPTDSVPRMVVRIVIKAVVRFMRNPEGYTQSRAGDETVIWNEDDVVAGSPSFTTEERNDLRELAGKSDGGLVSVSTTPWGRVNRGQAYESLSRRLPDSEGNTRRTNPYDNDCVLVPVDTGGAPIPFLPDPEQ